MSYQNTDIPYARLQILAIVFVLLMGAVMVRIWDVSVNQHEKWLSKVRASSELLVRVAAPRGTIRDRNGVAMVDNRPNFKVDFYLPEIVESYRKDRGGNIPKHDYEAYERGMRRKKDEPDIVKIVNESVIPPLGQMDLVRDYSSRELRNHYRQKLFVPYTYLQDVEFPVVARLAEKAVDVPGVDVSMYPARNYIYGSLAAHIIGYVGPLRDFSKETDLRRFHTAGYQPDDVGLANIERMYDSFLRGTPGKRVLQRDPKGVLIGEREHIDPIQGNDLCLTLDIGIQTVVERSLRKVGRGAAVVVDPRNGDILAMASVPSFDPNTFIPNIKVADWKRLLDDPTHPLTNRAILSFAPGSTYKIPIALSGMLNGLGSRTSFHCSGSVTYGNKAMKCWIADKGGAHGSLSLVEAIMRSCNAYFYQYGNAAGIEHIVKMGNALGLGQTSELGFEGESPGILPSPEWLKENYPRERWSKGYTANTSIGQGFVLASPLQMAFVTASVANGGVSYHPRLVDRVVNAKGEIVHREEPRIRADLRTLGVTSEQIEIVRSGMRAVVNAGGGTASAARVKGTTVAGKTGTAQVWRLDEKNVRVKDNHTWFIAFAPYDNPTLAVCVLVANGKSGGGVSAPIAAKIIEESLAIGRGYKPEIAKLEPAGGNFKAFDSVSFGDSELGEFAGSDEETADHTDSIGSDAAAGNAAEPQIAEEADEEGRVAQGGERRPGLLRNFFKSNKEKNRQAEAPQDKPRRRGWFGRRDQ